MKGIPSKNESDLFRRRTFYIAWTIQALATGVSRTAKELCIPRAAGASIACPTKPAPLRGGHKLQCLHAFGSKRTG